MIPAARHMPCRCTESCDVHVRCPCSANPPSRSATRLAGSAPSSTATSMAKVSAPAAAVTLPYLAPCSAASTSACTVQAAMRTLTQAMHPAACPGMQCSPCRTAPPITCMHVPAGWTQAPGREMEQGSGELAGCRVLTLTGARMEFVINNSEGGWCVPAPCRLLQPVLLACHGLLLPHSCQNRQSPCQAGACRCMRFWCLDWEA